MTDSQKPAFSNQVQALSIETPVGYFAAPLNPYFATELEQCQTEEDLFKLVQPRGFVNPDALNEVVARRIYHKYLDWCKAQKEAKENG